MPAARPHLSKSGSQLNELFESGKENPKVLREILRELKHRTTPSALALRKKVELALNGGPASDHSERRSRTSADARVPPSPKHQTIQCQSCRDSIRVPVRSETSIYSCPTCGAGFETSFNDGIWQVIWARMAPPDTDSAQMTEAEARALLSVSADADFSAIKSAWRKACQQYHPDKHQGLPERLRKAAEAETTRINEAYRLLERATVADF